MVCSTSAILQQGASSSLNSGRIAEGCSDCISCISCWCSILMVFLATLAARPCPGMAESDGWSDRHSQYPEEHLQWMKPTDSNHPLTFPPVPGEVDVCVFESFSNVSITIRWIVMNFGADVHDSRRMSCINADPLTCHLICSVHWFMNKYLQKQWL